MALGHAVYGWWPKEELLKLESGSLLRTIAGTYLGVFVDGARIYLDAGQQDGGVAVSLYAIASKQGVILVHEIQSALTINWRIRRGSHGVVVSRLFCARKVARLVRAVVTIRVQVLPFATNNFVDRCFTV